MLSIIAIILSLISITISIYIVVNYNINNETKQKIYNLKMNLNIHDKNGYRTRYYNPSSLLNTLMELSEKYGCILSSFEVDEIYNIVSFSLSCDNKQIKEFIIETGQYFPQAKILQCK